LSHEVNRKLRVIHNQGETILFGVVIDHPDHFLPDPPDGLLVIVLVIRLGVLLSALEQPLLFVQLALETHLLFVAQRIHLLLQLVLQGRDFLFLPLQIVAARFILLLNLRQRLLAFGGTDDRLLDVDDPDLPRRGRGAVLAASQRGAHQQAQQNAQTP